MWKETGRKQKKDKEQRQKAVIIDREELKGQQLINFIDDEMQKFINEEGRKLKNRIWWFFLKAFRLLFFWQEIRNKLERYRT